MDDPAEQSDRAHDHAQTTSHSWKEHLRYVARPSVIATLGASAGLLIVAVIPLFVSFSSTQIKDLFDQFTGGCVLVLDKAKTPEGKVFVSGRIAGTMPKSLPLMFEGRGALINSIQFASPYRDEQIREPDDLTYHPAAGQFCPGLLCEGYPDGMDFRTVRVQLLDVRPEFTYRFLVRLKLADPDEAASSKNQAALLQPANKTGLAAAAASPDNLKVYALYMPGIEGQVCRVEPRRWFNFWVWATPLKKAALFIFVIVAGGLLLRWARTLDRGTS